MEFGVHATNSNLRNDLPPLGEMLELVNQFRAKFPPEKLPVAIIVGRGNLFQLEALFGRVGSLSPLPPRAITDIEVRLDETKPPYWCEIEYADGHRETVDIWPSDLS